MHFSKPVLAYKCALFSVMVVAFGYDFDHRFFHAPTGAIVSHPMTAKTK